MKTLIEVIEAWVDDRVMAKIASSETGDPKWLKIAQLMQDVKQVEEENKALHHLYGETEALHIRDANRIAELERRVMGLDEDISFDHFSHEVVCRLESLESTVEEVESRVDEAYNMAESSDSQCDDYEYRISELEQKADEDLDLGDVISTVKDSVEEFIVDAVRTEIDAVDFKVTVER
jgi:chromosome segregation ATPase